MKRFILAAALAAGGLTGFPDKADAQYRSMFPGGGVVWSGTSRYYNPGFSLSIGTPRYNSFGWGYGYRPYWGYNNYYAMPHYGNYYAGFRGYNGWHRGWHGGWRW